MKKTIILVCNDIQMAQFTSIIEPTMVSIREPMLYTIHASPPMPEDKRIKPKPPPIHSANPEYKTRDDIPNFKKEAQTCAKNRAKRKKKKKNNKRKK